MDIFAGTASNIALKSAFGRKDVAIICGVNLNMLLTALNNQDKLPLPDLAAKVVADGKKAVLETTEILNK